MEIKLPEDLEDYKVHQIVSEIRDTDPVMYSELLPVLALTKSQKLKILDNMLMEHPYVYSRFVKK